MSQVGGALNLIFRTVEGALIARIKMEKGRDVQHYCSMELHKNGIQRRP